MNNAVVKNNHKWNDVAEVQNTIVIFTYKQWLLSIDMKTKIVEHVLWAKFGQTLNKLTLADVVADDYHALSQIRDTKVEKKFADN